MAGPNRRQQLLEGGQALVGIDFVEVEPTTQTRLWVYFIGEPADVFETPLGDFVGTVIIESLSGAASRPTVEVTAATWVSRKGRDVLQVDTATPGDFSRYALTLIDTPAPSRIDGYFNGVAFRFQAGCPSDLDCQPPAAPCPPVTEPDVTIDYTARDFGSFRRALFEFVAQRWPTWTDRLPADVGVMLMEAMSALADEMSYYQDRVARESTLLGASERRSLRQHARLLDFELHDGLAAWTWIDVTVVGATDVVEIPPGTAVHTPAMLDPAGQPIGEPIVFEIGRGLRDTHPAPDTSPMRCEAKRVWNTILAWIWDEGATCLPAGATAIDIDGPWVTNADPLWTGADRWLLLRSDPVDRSLPARRHLVKLTNAVEVLDALVGRTVTRLEWDASQSTPWPLDLATTTVHANLVPATAGRTVPAPDEPELLFRIANPLDAGPPAGWSFSPPGAVERQGPNETVTHLLPLLATEAANLCFIGEAPEAAEPEIVVEALDAEGESATTRWFWRRSMVGSPTAKGGEPVFTLDDGLWDEVARYWRGGVEPVRHVDYRTGRGFSVRFGDGSLGAVPDPDSVYRVIYRVGGGSAANVGADTLVETPLATIAVTNPFAVDSGVEPQSRTEILQLAPEAWQATAYRAVRPEDYAEALERLPWVARAGAGLRWTGSWLTLFATPDPRDAVTVTGEQRRAAEAQLDLFRQAGRREARPRSRVRLDRSAHPRVRRAEQPTAATSTPASSRRCSAEGDREDRADSSTPTTSLSASRCAARRSTPPCKRCPACARWRGSASAAAVTSTGARSARRRSSSGSTRWSGSSTIRSIPSGAP